MDPSTGQHQEMSNQTLETLLVCSKPNQDQKKPRPQPEQALKCPRCESTNTKFCYYNNYSLSQPRYFCKSCRRYWTKGGTLRNVPVGGGCRKNKRSSSSSKNKFQDEPLICTANSKPLITGLPSMGYDSIDLSLAFARLQKQSSSSSGGNQGFGGELSIFGNSTNTHSDVLGSNLSFDSINNEAFLGTQNGTFNNMCYGFMGDHNGAATNGEMVMPFEEIKQGPCINGNINNNISRENENNANKVLWGFPWQMNGETGMGSSDMDSRRESWNGFSSSSWHGLLNTPLM